MACLLDNSPSPEEKEGRTYLGLKWVNISFV